MTLSHNPINEFNEFFYQKFFVFHFIDNSVFTYTLRLHADSK